MCGTNILVCLMLLDIFMYCTEEGKYLLSGNHGVVDSQLSGSSFYMESLASSLAFGPAASRRGSSSFINVDKTQIGGGIVQYGAGWSPKLEDYKLLTVILKNKK